MTNILVVEDDKDQNRIICRYLTNSGFSVDGCFNGREAYDEMFNKKYDLIISDIMMPDVDGFEFASNIRSFDKAIPILFITARSDLSAKQKGYDIGIDDYMVKPIELEELLMRIRALLRRASIETAHKISIGNFAMDSEAMTAKVDEAEIQLTKREFFILFKFLSYPNKTFTRMELKDEFWGPTSDTGLRTVDVYITKLRSKLTDCDSFEIKTIRGIGYKAVLK